MSVGTLLLAGAIGGGGALARYGVDAAVRARAGRGFPWGILVVNLTGAFVLGVFVGAALAAGTYRLAGSALIGAYTTFSTWMLDSHRLGEERKRVAVAANLGASLLGGLALAWLGRAVGRSF